MYINQINTLIKVMTKSELQQLKTEVESLLERETVNERESITTVEVCPFCGSEHIKKNGKSSSKQRYYCNECHKSFSETTNTFIFHSKVTEQQWISFIDYEIARLPLREEAHFLDLSVTTCYFMRHKLYQAVDKLQLNEKLENKTELDSAYFKINLKGTKTENMPRYSKKRGNTSAYSGISHHKICVVTAIDENDHMIMNIAGLGPENSEKYSLLSSRFDDVDLIVSDSKPCIQQFSNLIEVRNDIIRVKPTYKNYKSEEGNTLGDVNELIENYRTSSKIYHGVSTRYLQGYMNFYVYRKQLLYRIKRKEAARYVFEQVKGVLSSSHDELQATLMPISLAEAYYEYHYGIFAQQHLS